MIFNEKNEEDIISEIINDFGEGEIGDFDLADGDSRIQGCIVRRLK